MDSKSSPSTSSTSPPRTSIKTEAPEEEVKDYAETAMNELLGWYGYERLELPRRWAAAARARREAAGGGGGGGSPDSSIKSPERKDKDECSWCNNPITTDSTTLHQSGVKFCSELCFSQSRRANFKRAKTCDWCRHVRHTVSYVDFQDGATQLQFCSDKCLNQYKMHIFCRETQAHLDLNPHLAGSASTSSLITPDLWLKNCKSRSVSPTSEKSSSPAAENVAVSKAPIEKPELISSVHRQRRKSPLPVITIAPTSKLMKTKHSSEERIIMQASPEHKKDLRSSKFNLRKRRSSRCSSTVTSQNFAKQNSTVNVPKAQDLRMSSPPSNPEPLSPSASSTMGNSTIQSPTHPSNSHHLPNMQPHNFPSPMFGVPPPMYIEGLNPNHINDPRFPTAMFHPPTFIPRPGIMFNHERPRIPQPFPFQQMGFGNPPPVTVLVPYPVVLPIPFPIPIPIPLPSMLQAYNFKKSYKPDTAMQPNDDENLEGPLDFTMNVDNKNKQDADNKELHKGDNDVEENIDQFNKEITNSIDDPEKTECDNPEQTLPRFKITRLGNKMAKIVTKPREPSESTRPLRKRRRLIEVHSEDDCSPLLTKSIKTVEV